MRRLAVAGRGQQVLGKGRLTRTGVADKNDVAHVGRLPAIGTIVAHGCFHLRLPGGTRPLGGPVMATGRLEPVDA